jgi:hypothetical protein
MRFLNTSVSYPKRLVSCLVVLSLTVLRLLTMTRQGFERHRI